MPEKLEYRVDKLEEKVEGMDIKLDKILTNHLPSIDTKIAVLIAQMVIILAGMAYLIFGGTP